MNLSVCCAFTTGLPVLSSINSSDFHSWEDQVLSTFHSEKLDECAYTTGLSVLSYFSVCKLRGDWLSCLVFPGLCDAVQASTSGVLSLHRETQFIVGLDFAVTLSSPESFCVRFDITSQQVVELKWLTSEIALGQYVCELVFGVNVFDLDLGVQTDSIEQPRATLWFWKHVSLSGFFTL